MKHATKNVICILIFRPVVFNVISSMPTHQMREIMALSTEFKSNALWWTFYHFIMEMQWNRLGKNSGWIYRHAVINSIYKFILNSIQCNMQRQSHGNNIWYKSQGTKRALKFNIPCLHRYFTKWHGRYCHRLSASSGLVNWSLFALRPPRAKYRHIRYCH